GFAVMTYKENGVGGLFAQGLGTSMLQVSNIVKNPWIVVPPTLAGAITGPMATCIFKMTNIPSGSGMGTCGLVGQIGTFTSMGFSMSTLVAVLVVQIIVPAILSVLFYQLLYKAGKIKDGDCQLGL
ncbi:MAG: PTS sugar transporter subunit IIC, partial [Firmicutes bacterium]|nr:PTS sugar transporter subunit IIC [Bacillota bacterium]